MRFYFLFFLQIQKDFVPSNFVVLSNAANIVYIFIFMETDYANSRAEGK